MSSNHRTYYDVYVCKNKLNMLVPENEASEEDYDYEVLATYDSHDMIGITNDTLKSMLSHIPLDLHYVDTWWYEEDGDAQVYSHWINEEGDIDYSSSKTPITLLEFLQVIASGNSWLRTELLKIETN